MRMTIMAAATAATLLGGCATSGYGDRGYYADRYYRDTPRYTERVLSDNDRIYVGRDGRYYCKRDDGTTGLIVGGIAGGVLGNIIARGGSKTLGTIIGAGAGALAGREIDKGNVRCR
jgi:outer membrane lipoprotein SlyB